MVRGDYEFVPSINTPEKLLANVRVQDYRSTYNDVRDWIRKEREGGGGGETPSAIDWNDEAFIRSRR